MSGIRQIAGLLTGVAFGFLGPGFSAGRFAAGQLLGDLFFGEGQPAQQGSTLGDLNLQQQGEYGRFLFEYFGTIKTQGIGIIDCRHVDGKAAPIEVVEETTGGGGGTGKKAVQPETINQVGYLSAAFGWGKGIWRTDKLIWQDGGGERVIYDRDGATDAEKGYVLTDEFDTLGNLVAELSDGLELWRGWPTQPTSATREAWHPEGVSADRGIAYTILKNFRITQTGTLTCIGTRLQPDGSAFNDSREIVEYRIEAAGVPARRHHLTQITGTVSGWAITRREAAIESISKIATLGLYDCPVPVDGLLQDRSRANPLYHPIPESDLGAQVWSGNDDSPPDLIKIQMRNIRDFPSQVVLRYQDMNNNWEEGTAIARMETAQHENVVEVEFPAAGEGEAMTRLAYVILYEGWAGAYDAEISTLPKHTRLAPGDVVLAQANNRVYIFRAAEWHHAPEGLIVVAGPAYDGGVYGQYKVTEQFVAPPLAVSTYDAPEVILLDTVALDNTMAESAGMLVAAGVQSGALWPTRGAQVQFSDASLGYVDLPRRATIGTLQDTYTVGDPTRFDYGTVLTVAFNSVNDALADASEDDVLNKKANTLALGELILQFTQATQVSPTTWDITGLLPARKGSDYIESVASGSRVVKLTDESGAQSPAVVFHALPYSAIGSEIEYTALMNTSAAENDGTQTFTYEGNNLKPLAPSRVRIVERDLSTLRLMWDERTRSEDGASWALRPASDPTRFEVEVEGVTKTVSALEAEFAASEFGGTIPSVIDGSVTGLNDIVGRGFAREFSSL